MGHWQSLGLSGTESPDCNRATQGRKLFLDESVSVNGTWPLDPTETWRLRASDDLPASVEWFRKLLEAFWS